MTKQKEPLIITGSSGLLGSAIMERLADKYRIFGLDIQSEDEMPDGCTFVETDLTSDESVENALQQVRNEAGTDIRSVVHLAAYYDFSGDPSPMYDELTVRGTERLIHALQSFAVGQFIFSSTMLVQAPAEPGQPINEDGMLEPKWDYPQSKVRVERLLHEKCGDIPTVILRIAGVYDDCCHSIPLAHQIQRIYERRMTSKVFPGNIHHGQSYIHLQDTVDAVEKAVARQGQLPEELVLLLGEGETMSYGDIQRALGQLIHGEEWETAEIPKAVAKTGAWIQENVPIGEEPFIKPWMVEMADDHYELDISRAKETIGWQPGHSLRQTLPKMVAALQSNPVDWYREHNLEIPAEMQEMAGAR